MKFHTEYLTFHTKKHREYIHITDKIGTIVAKAGIKEGMVLVSAMHITAGVYVNDNESGLIQDIDQWLEGLAPFRDSYKHHETGETNGGIFDASHAGSFRQCSGRRTPRYERRGVELPDRRSPKIISGTIDD